MPSMSHNHPTLGAIAQATGLSLRSGAGHLWVRSLNLCGGVAVGVYDLASVLCSEELME
jgi:hypothetical protein